MDLAVELPLFRLQLATSAAHRNFCSPLPTAGATPTVTRALLGGDQRSGRHPGRLETDNERRLGPPFGYPLGCNRWIANSVDLAKQSIRVGYCNRRHPLCMRHAPADERSATSGDNSLSRDACSSSRFQVENCTRSLRRSLARHLYRGPSFVFFAPLDQDSNSTAVEVRARDSVRRCDALMVLTETPYTV